MIRNRKANFTQDFRPQTNYNRSMRATSRSALRKKGFKLEALTPVSLRLPAEIWEKCGWAADAVGLTRTEFVRNTLARATQGAEPPATAKSRMILASAEEWKAWQIIADHCDVPLNELMRRSVNRLIPVVRAQGVPLDDVPEE